MTVEEKPSPEYEFNPEGLTLRSLILAALSSPDVHTLLDCKISVDTMGKIEDDKVVDEGWTLGNVVEFQWGRDGRVYLRIDREIEPKE